MRSENEYEDENDNESRHSYRMGRHGANSIANPSESTIANAYANTIASARERAEAARERDSSRERESTSDVPNKKRK